MILLHLEVAVQFFDALLQATRGSGFTLNLNLANVSGSCRRLEWLGMCGARDAQRASLIDLHISFAGRSLEWSNGASCRPAPISIRLKASHNGRYKGKAAMML